MDASDEIDDIVDAVNALLRLDVGDPYRLEHIKQAYIENKTIWESDKKYLEKMKEKYLTRLHADTIETDENLEEILDNTQTIHCWKCGKKCLLKANFCMSCGAALFDVGNNNLTPTQQVQGKTTTIRKSIGLKIPIMIGIPVLVLAIIGGAYSQGYFDDALDRYSSDEDVEIKPVVSEETTSGESNSKCGKGTIYDPKTNACILEN